MTTLRRKRCKPKHSITRLLMQPSAKRRLANNRGREIKLEVNNIQINLGLPSPTSTKERPTKLHDNLTDWEYVEERLSKKFNLSQLTKEQLYSLLKSRLPSFENQSQYDKEIRSLCAYLNF
jgi:hypothetical protein